MIHMVLPRLAVVPSPDWAVAYIRQAWEPALGAMRRPALRTAQASQNWRPTSPNLPILGLDPRIQCGLPAGAWWADQIDRASAQLGPWVKPKGRHEKRRNQETTMPRRLYPAIVHTDDGITYGTSLVDFPIQAGGCRSRRRWPRPRSSSLRSSMRWSRRRRPCRTRPPSPISRQRTGTAPRWSHWCPRRCPAIRRSFPSPSTRNSSSALTPSPRTVQVS